MSVISVFKLWLHLKTIHIAHVEMFQQMNEQLLHGDSAADLSYILLKFVCSWVQS